MVADYETEELEMPAKRARSYHLVKLTVRCSPPRACGCVIPEHGFAQSALSHAHLFGRAPAPSGTQPSA